ncbi:MAG: sugar ABC transporter substrate-binding protein [Treponema sp.]|jgi:ABC-type glycerol-3-phosphate transport system substrate-binding protein|nr:sugar ABC transporter substrate-binding protein [Treponema sp.]
MRKRERECLFLIAFCLIFAMAVCSCKAKTAPATTAETSAPKYAGETINLLLSAGPYCESIEPIVKEFEKVYPGVTLNYDLMGRSNSDERTIIELSSGSDAHDIYYVYGESLIQFTGNDWLEPLDAYIADKSITNDALLQLDDFSEGPLEACRYQGKLYGLPIFSATCIMYYRTDFFEQAGIAGPPKTWDELVEACKKLKAIGVQPLGMRGAKAFGGAGWHLPMLTHSFGGTVYKDFPNDFHPTVNQPAFVEAVQFYSDLLNNYGIKGATTCNYEDIILAVQQGTVGIWIDGAPLVKQYVDPDKSKSAGKIGFSVIPAGRMGVKAAQTIHLLAMGKGSKHKNLAWEFLQWATSHDILTRLSVEGIHVAIPRTSVLNDPRYIAVNNFGDGAWAKAFSECLTGAAKDYYPLTKDFPEVSDIITASLSEVFTGKNAQQAMDEANRKIDSLMKQEGYY